MVPAAISLRHSLPDLTEAEVNLTRKVTWEEKQEAEKQYKVLAKYLIDSISMSCDGNRSYQHHYNDNILANTGKLAGLKVTKEVNLGSINLYSRIELLV